MKDRLKQVKHIAEAYTKSLPVAEYWFQQRLDTCSGCEYNSDNVEDFPATPEQQVANIYCLRKRSCTACGCCIDRKASVKAETCGLIKIGLKPKWEALVMDFEKNKSMKMHFLTPEAGKAKESELGITVDLRTNKETELISFTFQLSHKQPIRIDSATPTCHCTTVEVTEINSKTHQFAVKISTKNFRENTLSEKKLEIKYSFKNNNQNTFIANFKYIK